MLTAATVRLSCAATMFGRFPARKRAKSLSSSSGVQGRLSDGRGTADFSGGFSELLAYRRSRVADFLYRRLQLLARYA